MGGKILLYALLKFKTLTKYTKDWKDSGTNGLENSKCCAPNHYYTNKTGLFEKETGRFAQKIVILQNS
jgi:hypothetical protein